jgi:hypothetical protein
MNPKISGFYKEVFSTSAERKAKGTEVELRIDVDGERPMNVISGDIYSNSGRIRQYLRSFRFEEVKKVRTANEILLTGTSGKFDPDSNRFINIQVTISQNSFPPVAVAKWTNSSGAASKSLCKYKSKYFRSVQLEHDYEEGVAPFESYDTNDLFSPSPYRSHPLSFTDAFAEAGIEIIIAKKKPELVPHPKRIPGQGSIWTDDELNAAMIKHFSMLKGKPQWKVWLFSALEYALSDVKGIVLANKGKQRLGCVVFQRPIGWQTSQEKRMRLFIYVHELGHCFNLEHPWKKSETKSGVEVSGCASPSWMNYPWRYYASNKSHGEEAFWKAFHFQFSDSELIHLRHGFRNDVIFGGNTFSEES